MITLKLPYKSTNMSEIAEYQRQYSLCLRFLYNRLYDSKGVMKEKELRQFQSKLNNIENIGCWLFQSAIREAIQIYNTYEDRKIVFGTKKALIARNKNKISKEEYKSKRLRSIYSIGEASKHGNRHFRIVSDSKIVFQPNRNTKIELNLAYKDSKLSKLFALQQENKIALTYTLNANFVCITYDEKELENYNHIKVENRVLALDLNPNWIGLSIVDWKSSSKYEIIYSKTFDLNRFDRKENFLSKKKHELIEISKHIVNLVIHYQCSILAIEDLNIKSCNKGKGTHYNRMCNNTWLRNIVAQQLSKRCNIHNIAFVKVKADYSSFIGNLMFREEKKFDPVLASIEIGRRGYEFVNQYVDKKKEKKKNIVFPDKEDFRRQYIKSMEEFDILDKVDLSWKELYSYAKETKMMYRFPLIDAKVFKFKSKHCWTKIII